MKANKLFLNVALFSILVIVIGIGIYKYRKENFIDYEDMSLDQLQSELKAALRTYSNSAAELRLLLRADAAPGSQTDAYETKTMLAKLRQVSSEVLKLNAEIERKTATIPSREQAIYLPTVTLDTSGGKTMGIKLMKNPAGGGVAVKSIDAGGQAEDTGKFTVGDVITHVNGTDISVMSSMKEIGAILKASETVALVLVAGAAPPPVEESSYGAAAEPTAPPRHRRRARPRR